MEKENTYSENFTERLLRLTLDVGEGMLKCGAEISRIEDTVERICYAYGAAHVEVFTITSVIVAEVRMEDGAYSSQIRRVLQADLGTDLSLTKKTRLKTARNIVAIATQTLAFIARRSCMRIING